MQDQRENLFEVSFVQRMRRSFKIFTFALFFSLLASILAGGNIFFEYTLAVENGQAEDIFLTPSPAIYDGVYAAFQDEAERGVERLVLDSVPEIELMPDPIARREPEQKIGVYIHMNNIANKNFLAAEIAELGKIQDAAIIFDVKGSFVYFDSNSEIAKKYGLKKPLYDLPAIVTQLESAGIYTIARVITVKDPEFAFKNPQVWLKNPWTNVPVPEWVDPANVEVLEYNRQVISEIVAAGVDEINLDFVRYPDKFTSAWLGISGEEKMKNILNFVKMAREAIDAQKLNAVLSVDTFAVLPWDGGATEAALGQDMRQLGELADIIAPMLYPATFSRDNPNYFLKGESFEYSTVYLTLRKYQEALGENSYKLRPWIQGYYNSEKEISEQIKGVFAAGVCGFTVWDIQNDYTEVYKILGTIERPANCRD